MSAASAISEFQVLIRADASPRIGGGHLMRCLALAEELRGRGGAVRFASALVPDFLAQRIIGAGFELERLVAQPELAAEGPDWERATLSDEAQRNDCALALASGPAPDWVVVDHYRLGQAWHEDVPSGCRRLVLDDLANRPLSAELLVDPTVGRSAKAYRPLVPETCRLLLGSRYALLDRAFAARRSAALKRRREAGPVRRILVAFGLMDLGDHSLAVVQSLRSAGVTCAIELMVGPSAPSLPELRALARRDPGILLKIDCHNVARSMASADLAIGAPGSMSWERCCLGLPTILLPLAANQSEVALQLEAAGAALLIAEPEQAGPAIASLLGGGRPLALLSAAAAALVDGAGTARVADAMLRAAAAQAPAIRLRRAHQGDSEQLWLWRNTPAARAASKSDSIIPWLDHARWFDQVLADPAVCLFLADIDQAAAGMVRFDRSGETATVSINVDPDFQGRKVGRTILAEACERYLSAGDAARLRAEVRPSNVASERIFEAAGFVAATDPSADFREYWRGRSPGRHADGE